VFDLEELGFKVGSFYKEVVETVYFPSVIRIEDFKPCKIAF
jgi:hypothetical protein